MPLLPRLRNLWRNLFQQVRREQELNEELEAYLELLIEEKISAGLAPEEARRAALLELGGKQQVKEQVREVRLGHQLETVWQDLRYALRMLRRNPVFVGVAVLTLALGIGANTAILSVVNGMILRPLPVEHSEQLVTPFWGSKKDAEVWGRFSYANYKDLRAQNQSLAGLLAWSQVSAGISTEEASKADSNRAEVAYGELVSANYFDVLGVKPLLGRGFLPEEERTPNTHPVVVISEALWQERFQRAS